MWAIAYSASDCPHTVRVSAGAIDACASTSSTATTDQAVVLLVILVVLAVVRWLGAVQEEKKKSLHLSLNIVQPSSTESFRKTEAHSCPKSSR
jgi:hypothetical protein